MFWFFLAWEDTGRAAGEEQCLVHHLTLPTAALCVEDDLWDLSILHRSAVVVAGSITESEAGLGACCRRLVDHFTQPFGSIVGIGALWAGAHRESKS